MNFRNLILPMLVFALITPGAFGEIDLSQLSEVTIQEEKEDKETQRLVAQTQKEMAKEEKDATNAAKKQYDDAMKNAESALKSSFEDTKTLAERKEENAAVRLERVTEKSKNDIAAYQKSAEDAWRTHGNGAGIDFPMHSDNVNKVLGGGKLGILNKGFEKQYESLVDDLKKEESLTNASQASKDFQAKIDDIRTDFHNSVSRDLVQDDLQPIPDEPQIQ